MGLPGQILADLGPPGADFGRFEGSRGIYLADLGTPGADFGRFGGARARRPAGGPGTGRFKTSATKTQDKLKFWPPILALRQNSPKLRPQGGPGNPKRPPKTKFRKITPLEGSGGPPRQNSAKLRPSRGPEAPQDKIPQNYAPRGVRRPTSPHPSPHPYNAFCAFVHAPLPRAGNPPKWRMLSLPGPPDG